ncbi:MAG TPA: hypothetical protein VNL18_00615 [Gemmatimonadales bacterium]|nr:hypothetical protein [Gemmatimonadales bacterium]
MRALTATLLLPLTFALAGCGDSSSEPRTPSASGTWTGAVGSATFTLTLAEQRGGTITGAGSARATGGAVSLTVTGTHVHPSISLTLRSTGFEDLNYTGQFINDNTISGSLNGSGFTGETLTLVRQ